MVYQYRPVDMMGAFAQGYQTVRGVQEDMAARRQAAIDQQNAQVRQRDLQGAIANLRMNPSPEAIAEFGLQFPEMKEQMEGYYKTLSEGKKVAQREAAQKIIMAQRSGGDVAAILEEYAVAAENARDPVMAQEFRDAAAFAKENPEAAAETARLRLAFTDPDAYKLVYASADPTAFQKDFEFIKQQFGVEAATEFAQFGRDGAPVSIPLGNGQTYVGPASMAPGASRWQMQGGQPAQPAPSGDEPSVLKKAFETKTITPEEAAVVRKSLGPKGQKAFEDWMKNNKIVISRTVDGKTYYQVNGKWYDNPEGR